ncbi:unnamed protein product [Meganyctiphanes norvegica]|uniref:Uncharacterized protein n=1 Tax=Meganyctiphanes norvegica TaxID=48144 RepID=A0AAV2SAE8_MEGNR
MFIWSSRRWAWPIQGRGLLFTTYRKYSKLRCSVNILAVMLLSSLAVLPRNVRPRYRRLNFRSLISASASSIEFFVHFRAPITSRIPAYCTLSRISRLVGRLMSRDSWHSLVGIGSVICIAFLVFSYLIPIFYWQHFLLWVFF